MLTGWKMVLEISQIYSAFFKAQDRFLQKDVCQCGFEPDVIHEYIHWAMLLSSAYRDNKELENDLLCEFFLKQVYHHLLRAIEDSERSRAFRRVCLDSVHTPLLGLKRHFYRYDDGPQKFLTTKLELQRIQAPYD